METVLCDTALCDCDEPSWVYASGSPVCGWCGGRAKNRADLIAEHERNEREYQAWLDACREG